MNTITEEQSYIENIIRLNKGNKPRLTFVETDGGRCIGVPEWYEEKKIEPIIEKSEAIEIGLSEDILNKVVNIYSLLSFTRS